MDKNKKNLKLVESISSSAQEKENFDVMDTGNQHALEGNSLCCSNLIWDYLTPLVYDCLTHFSLIPPH